MTTLIDEKDARAMVRLVAEVAGLHADHAIAKRYLMDGLKEMIGADCWAWSLGYFHPEKAPSMCQSFMVVSAKSGLSG